MANQSVYKVVGRGRASAIFREGGGLNLTFNLEDGKTATVWFRTRYLKSDDKTYPEDLWFEIAGPADSLNQAIENYGNMAMELTTALALASNASMGRVEPELAYDDTPNVEGRKFIQIFVPQPPVVILPGRVIDVEAAAGLISKIYGHEDAVRIRRAIGQYATALNNWRPGDELTALEHIFMAAETFTPVVLREFKKQRGLSDDELAREWGYVEPKNREAQRGWGMAEFLNVNARIRLIFEHDIECYQEAKNVSDEYEHGITAFTPLHHRAKRHVVKAAGYLRATLLRTLLGNDAERMLASPYSKARGPLRSRLYLRADLVGPHESLAEASREYPMFDMRVGLQAFSCDENTGIYTFTPDICPTAVIGKACAFKNLSVEMWDGSAL